MNDTLPSSGTVHPTLSVIIPIYNENIYIRELLRRVLAVPIPKEIILVDDGSTDGTIEQLRRLEKDPAPLLALAPMPTTLRFLYHAENQGKGASIRTAVAVATGYITLIQDADLEYNPQDYPKLMSPILQGDADIVYGSRFRGEILRVHYYWHALGNKLLSLLSNILTGLTLTDLECCYKVFKTDILRSIPIRSNRFGFEPEITAKVAKLKCRIYEVPVSYRGRTYEEGKKVTWWDGMKAVLTIFRFWIVDDLFDKTALQRNLRIMEGASAYNQWLFHQCKESLGRRVLEVGSGAGNITKYLLDKDFLVATDYDKTYIEELKTKYGHFSNVRVQQLNLVDDTSVQSVAALGVLDGILSMNVLEHIQDDRKALASKFKLLSQGGKLVLLVPAHQILYSDMDRNVDHYRRYNIKGLSNLLEATGFKIQSIRYLNWLGAIGWFVNGRILRRQLIPSRQLRLFNFLMPLVWIEKFIPFPFGISVLAIAEKPT